MSITSLHRYAIKGLSGDSVQRMKLKFGDGTFEDDRRFALLYDESEGLFDEENPEWLHKVCHIIDVFETLIVECI